MMELYLNKREGTQKVVVHWWNKSDGFVDHFRYKTRMHFKLCVNNWQNYAVLCHPITFVIQCYYIYDKLITLCRLTGFFN